MTPAEHQAQKDRVRASELREQRHGEYACHPLARAIPQGQPTIGSLSQSIRELGEMLVVAERHPVFRERMVEVERLTELVSQRLAALQAEIRNEFLRAMI